MKSKILSFLAVLTCLCFTASPLCVGAVAPVIEEVIVETAFNELIAESKKLIDDAVDNVKSYKNGLLGLTMYAAEKGLEYAANHATSDNNANSPVLAMPSFDIVTGKYQMTWDIGNYSFVNGDTVLDSVFTDYILIECTLLLTDSWSGEYADPATGVTYYSNAANISITRTNGSITRYIVVFPTNFNYSRNVQVLNDRVTVSPMSGCSLYTVDGGKIGQLLENNFYLDRISIITNDRNITTVSANSAIGSGAYPQLAYPSGIISFRGTTISGTGLNYPVDKDICHGSFNLRVKQRDSNAYNSYTFYCLSHLTCGFYTTNNYNHQGVVNNSWTNIYQQNYYNFPLTNNTPITKDNYLDLNLPALKPVFDIDTQDSDWLQTLLALLPTLIDLFDGDILPNILDLLGRIADFWGNMPDIGMEWNVDPTLNNNNYMELDFPSSNPPDDGGGGGSGGGTIIVDPWEPPEYPPVNTAPFIPATYPTIPTGTLPTNFAQNMGSVLQDGWDIFDHLEVLGVICPLVVIVLLWRITGK